jgi:hypothetical protein
VVVFYLHHLVSVNPWYTQRLTQRMLTVLLAYYDLFLVPDLVVA